MATAPASQPVSKPGPVAVPAVHAKFSKGRGKIGILIFGVVLILGVVYTGSHLINESPCEIL